METLTNEIKANEKAAQKVIDDEKAQKEKDRIATEKLNLQAFTDFKLKRIKDETDAEFKIRIDAAKKIEKAKEDLQKRGFALAKILAGENEGAQKAIAVTEATIQGIQGVQNAYTTAQKSPFTAAFPGYPLVQAGLAAAFSATQIQKILSASSSGGGSGSVGGSAPATPATPSPQMMSGAFDLSGGLEPEPTRTYVVTDEMTNSQNQLANIRRRATI